MDANARLPVRPERRLLPEGAASAAHQFGSPSLDAGPFAPEPHRNNILAKG